MCGGDEGVEERECVCVITPCGCLNVVVFIWDEP